MWSVSISSDGSYIMAAIGYDIVSLFDFNDNDDDGYPNVWEINHGFDPNNPWSNQLDIFIILILILVGISSAIIIVRRIKKEKKIKIKENILRKLNNYKKRFERVKSLLENE